MQHITTRFMHQYLSKYFLLHKKLVLPGIGLLSEETRPAHLEFVDKLLYPPVHIVSFQQDETITDNAFPVFLSHEMKLNETDAANNFEAFIMKCKTALQGGTVLPIAGLGTLEKNEQGYSFTTSETIQFFFPSITAERVIRQHAQHNVRVGEDEKTSVEMQEILHKETVKDNWWIAAIVLAVAGVAAIIYYYVTKPA